LCYRYTIPQRISEQFQSLAELFGGGAQAWLTPNQWARTALFYPYVTGVGKHAGDPIPAESPPLQDFAARRLGAAMSTHDRLADCALPRRSSCRGSDPFALRDCEAQ
jgi:hypothetical protein